MKILWQQQKWDGMGMGATWLIGQGASMAAEPWEQQHRWVGLKGKIHGSSSRTGMAWEGSHMADGHSPWGREREGRSDTPMQQKRGTWLGTEGQKKDGTRMGCCSSSFVSRDPGSSRF